MLPNLRKLLPPLRRKSWTDEEYRRHAALKQRALESQLGDMHDMVMHSIIPFAVGGAVDMYYFPRTLGGTAFATQEMIEPDGSGPRPSSIGTYELVAFSKYSIGDEDTREAFQRTDRRIRVIFTALGRYAAEAVLNPGETAEVPAGEGLPNYCLILDRYERPGVPFVIGKRRHGLLLVIQLFRTEVFYAKENGSAVLLNKLKERGHYPYSDLDRLPVL